MIPADAPEDVWQLAKDWPLAFKFDLPKDAKVVIAGAYKGLAMELLRSIYPTCQLYGFEPQDWATEEAAKRMRFFPPDTAWWSVEPYGLGIEDSYLQMGEWHTDACSFIKIGEGTREQGFGYLIEFGKAMQKQAVEYIDLLVLNTEGYEWLLLPYLYEQGWLSKIDKLAVQFHLGMGHDNDIMSLGDKLSQTHFLKEDQFPAWQYWEKL